MKCSWLRSTITISLVLGASQGASATLLRPADRILFAGDSITGQSMNLADGYRNQMAWAIKQVHPAASNVLLSLGGSGQGVGSWMSVATRTNASPSCLDVPGIDVRTTLDAGADVLVIMLGMNDLLAPHIADTPEGIREWRHQYIDLIRALRTRTHPRLVGLGTITLLTEDPQSPKNMARAKLNQQIAEIAAAEGCLVFRTGEETEGLLHRGRMLKPDFHVANDFVHPGAAGHAAIAMAMLQGLGETDAAQLLDARCLSALVPASAYPTLSYDLVSASRGNDTQTQTYTIAYAWNAGPTSNRSPRVTLALPDTWRLDRQVQAGTTGVFTVTGNPDKITNTVVLTATSGEMVRTQTIAIPTPWRVSAGIPNPAAWPRRPSFTFDPTNSIRDSDLPLIRGEAFSASITNRESVYPWTIYTPSVNYTGGSNPGSIDAFAVAFCNVFDCLYATRWVHSDKARNVDLRLSTSVFAGTIGLNVWVNGQSCYANTITSEPAKTATASAILCAGWNRILIKCDHVQWQWQFACALSGRGSDDLAELRYAAVPPTLKPDRVRHETSSNTGEGP